MCWILADVQFWLHRLVVRTKVSQKGGKIMNWLKPGIHFATDCNATLRRSQLQHVWRSVAASCSQSQISDTVRYFPATIRRVASCRSVYVGELQVHKPMKACFAPFIFSPMRACRSVALRVVAACMCSSFRYLRQNLRRCVAVNCYVYAWLQVKGWAGIVMWLDNGHSPK